MIAKNCNRASNDSNERINFRDGVHKSWSNTNFAMFNLQYTGSMTIGLKLSRPPSPPCSVWDFAIPAWEYFNVGLISNYAAQTEYKCNMQIKRNFNVISETSLNFSAITARVQTPIIPYINNSANLFPIFCILRRISFYFIFFFINLYVKNEIIWW